MDSAEARRYANWHFRESALRSTTTRIEGDGTRDDTRRRASTDETSAMSAAFTAASAASTPAVVPARRASPPGRASRTACRARPANKSMTAVPADSGSLSRRDALVGLAGAVITPRFCTAPLSPSGRA